MAKILAVDDDALARSVLIDALRGLSHDVVGAGGGQEALDRLVEDVYALVVTDVRMPEMDGIELARRVATMAKPPPVLLASGVKGGEVVGEALRSGVSVAGFVAKPLEPNLLSAAINRAMGPRRPADSSWSGEEFLRRVDGPLSRYPLVRVLFLAHRIEANGRVVVRRPGRGELAIVLRAGRVVAVSGAPWLLGTLSKDLPDHADLAVDVENAVRAGFPADGVLRAASEGLGAHIASIADARTGSIRWDPDFTPPTSAFPLPVPLPRLMALGLRDARPAATIAAEWGRRLEAPIQLVAPDDSPETKWGIDMTGLRIMRLAPTHGRVGDLVAAAIGKDSERRGDVLRSMDLLHQLGILEVPPPDVPLAGGSSAEVTHDPRLAELRAGLAAMDGKHPLELLALADARSVERDLISAAFREASRRFHPDRFAGASVAVREAAAACFDRLRAAHEELSSPTGFVEAQRFLQARALGETYVSGKQRTTAKILFRRGEVLFRNRDWKAADPLLLEAWRLDPQSWPHALYQAWCGWLARRVPTTEALRQVQALDVTEPKHQAEIQVVIGTILKLEGREEDAQQRFQEALAKDPENREAQRELRLRERRSVPTAPPPSPSMFDNLRAAVNRKK